MGTMIYPLVAIVAFHSSDERKGLLRLLGGGLPLVTFVTLHVVNSLITIIKVLIKNENHWLTKF
jgi:hypothetical protein